jgi:hypothetical protein
MMFWFEGEKWEALAFVQTTPIRRRRIDGKISTSMAKR